MKVLSNDALAKYERAVDEEWFAGTRLKEVRATPLKPGGRTEMTLFEQATDEGRAHPRMRFATPPAVDPHPRHSLLDPRVELVDVAALRGWIEDGLRGNAAYLAGQDLKDISPPKGSDRYFLNSVRAQRTTQAFAEARARLAALVAHRGWSEEQETAARYAIHEPEDEAFAGDVHFDNSDTGTYHSYGHDKPFVHYLEMILGSLPVEGTRPFAVLSGDQQAAVRNQREQVQHHLDYLMRHKYANNGVLETDIERSVGGFLIDRDSRRMVSERRESEGSLTPAYELLQIKPGADHPRAGAYLYRAGDTLHLEGDHAVVDVDAALVRAVPVDADRLTFRRAPEDPHLRAGVRFDWDGNGYVQPEKVAWVGWAGHCDIKAIMESLGVTLVDDEPSVEEYRADTGSIQHYKTKHLIEMIASVMGSARSTRTPRAAARCSAAFTASAASATTAAPTACSSPAPATAATSAGPSPAARRCSASPRSRTRAASSST